MTSALVPFQQHASSVEEVLSEVNSVSSREEFAELADVLRDIKTRRKLIDEEREKVIRPQREALAASRALFDRLDERYKWAEDKIKGMLALFQQEEQEREKRLLEAALDAHNARAIVNLAAQAAPVAQGVSMRAKYDFVVTDPGLVPDEYWTLDHKKIGADVRSSKGTIQIPGVQIVQSTTVGVRSK